MNQAYYIIYQFMTDKLAIPKPALDVFAIIYSFSGSGQGVFAARREYIAKLANMNIREVYRGLRYLIDRGLIVKGVAPSPVKVSYVVSEKYRNMHEMDMPSPTEPSYVAGRMRPEVGADNYDNHGRVTVTNSQYHSDTCGRVTVTNSQSDCDKLSHNNKRENKNYNEWRNNGRDAQRKGKEKKENSYIPKYGNFDIRDALAAALERSYGKKVNREDID